MHYIEICKIKKYELTNSLNTVKILMGDNMEFVNLRIKDVEYAVKYTPSKATFVSKNKPSHIIGLQISGTAEHDFGFQKLMFKESTIYFLNKDEDYSVKVFDRGIAFSVHFTTYEPISTHSFSMKIQSTSEVMRILEKIDQELKSSKRDHIVLSNLYALCGLYNEYIKSKYTTNNERSIIAKQYIDTHFKDKTCIADVSELCGVTVRRFNDLFKGWFLTSPNKYIVSKKIEFAKLLLISGPISISDVAAMAGFTDVYYFSKCFKSYCDISPTEYQKTYNKI